MSALDDEFIKRALSAAPTSLYVYDIQSGQNIFQNRYLSELLGYPPAEDGSDWLSLIHPEDADRLRAHRDGLKKVQPGKTVSAEFRVRDSKGSWRWFQVRDTLLSQDGEGRPNLAVGSTSEITEHIEAAQRTELLAEEMRHRARNLVAIVQAIGRMSRPKNQPEANKHIDAFMGRLLALLNTGEIILSSEKRTADLAAVAIATLSPFGAGSMSPRITTSGPAILLPERIAGGLAMAFHELATNATKYGALSVEKGTVALTWVLAGEPAKPLLSIDWKEQNGPAVAKPTTEGFGGLVIRQSVIREPNGEAIIEYAPNGLNCRLKCEVHG